MALELVLVFAACCALQLLLHEALHAAAALINGGRVTAFKPYPHRHNGKLFFGRVAWEGKLTPKQIALGKLIVFPVGALSVIASGTLISEGFTDPWVVCFGLAALIDTARGLLMPLWSDGGDLHQGMSWLDMEPAPMPLTAAALISIWILAWI